MPEHLKKLRGLIGSILLLAVLFCVPEVLTAHAQTAAEEQTAEAKTQDVRLQYVSSSAAASGSIDLSLTYGYQNIAKSGRFLPLDIKVANGTGQDIDGELVIELAADDGLMLRYSYPVSASAGRETKVRGTVSMSDRSSELHLLLKAKDGAVLAEKRVPVEIQGNGSELLIGILSNRPQDLAYFRGVSIGGTVLKTRTVTLNPGDIPVTEEGLEQLDVMIISDFNMYRLTDEVVNAICEWVEEGGCLLLGTGRSGDRLGGFAKRLPEIRLGDPEQADVDMGLKYSTDGPDGAVLSLPVRQVYAEDGTQAMQSGSLAVLTKLELGSGTVGITAYDLCDIRDFCMEQMGYTDELLQALMGAARIGQAFAIDTEENGSYETVKYLVSSEDPARIPSLTLYFLIAAAYLLLVGPGLYFYLRAKGLAALYPAGVILTAFLSALGLWVFGSGSRFEGPFINYAAVRELSGDGVSETEFLSLSSPQQRSIELPVPSEYMIQPVTKGEENEETKKEQDTQTESQRLVREEAAARAKAPASIEIAHSAQGKMLRTKDLKPFSEHYFELYRRSRKEELPEDFTEPIALDLQYFDDTVSGSIENRSDTALKCVTLLLYGRIVSIGDIGAGEKKQLENQPVLYGPTGSTDLIASYAAESGAGAGNAGDERGAREAAVLTRERTRLLSWYMEESLSGYYSGARLIAFLDTDTALPSMEGSEIERRGTTLLSVSAELRFAKGDEVTRSALSTAPKVISGAYEAASNTTGGGAAVVLEYSLGSDLKITHVRFNALSSVFSGKEDQGQKLTVFRGALAFYNYETSSYDLIDAGKTDWTGEELKPYLSPASTLTVRYIPDENAAEGTVMFLPVPIVTGTETGA